MKKPDLVKAVERAVEIKMRAVDILVDELVEPLADVGNPEDLIRKKYSDWDAQDLQLLIKIYGEGDNTALARLIFSREYEKVKALEREEKG